MDGALRVDRSPLGKNKGGLMRGSKKTAPADSARLDALRSVVTDLNKMFKEEVATVASEGGGLLGDVKKFVSTGVYQLDLALRGGIPLGRVVEVFGWPSAGKTTLSMQIAAQFQKAGGVVVLFDSEFAWEEERVRKMGVDPAAMLVMKNGNVIEDVFEQSEAIIKKLRSVEGMEDVPILIIWDSYAMSDTRIAQAEDAKDEIATAKPKALRKGLRRLTKIMNNMDVTFLAVNQMVNGPSGPSTPGPALQFAASMRIKVAKLLTLKSDTVGPIGIQVGAFIEKNKVSGAMPKAFDVKFPIFYEGGVDEDAAMLEYLGALSIPQVKKAGAWYTLNAPSGVIKTQAREARGKLDQDPKAREWLRTIVKANFLRNPAEAVQEE